MGNGISGKITDFLREFVLIFSSILTIIGVILIFIGVGGFFFRTATESILKMMPSGFFDWSLYILIFGFVVFAFGFYYLYVFFKNKKFILEELKTNKRSELKKRHLELKRTVKHMPKKYKDMLRKKEKELNLK